MSILKFRVLLDDAEMEAYRDIEIDDGDHFESLHLKIVESFGLRGDQMASFYESDGDWEKGEEIPLMDMEVDELAMRDVKLKDKSVSKGGRFFYIYNFLTLWIFYLEVMEVKTKQKGTTYPNIVKAHGPNIKEDIRNEDSEMPEMESMTAASSSDDPYGLDDLGDLDPLDGEYEDIDDYDF